MNAFVIMPFAPEFEEIYNLFIATTLIESGFEVSRADDILSQRNILEDIVRSIIDSDLIVADLTGKNPNVYYELGLAHALGKPVILLIQSIEDLPFDLRSYRVVTYNTHFASIQKAKKELLELATGVKTGSIPFGNPIRDFATDIISDNILRSKRKPTSEAADADMGFLDHMVEMEDGLGGIVTIVGHVTEFTGFLTGKVQETAERIGNLSSQHQQGNAKKIQALARSLGEIHSEYSEKMAVEIDNYSQLLGRLETSLEYVVSAHEILTEEQRKQLQEFLDSLAGAEEASLGGRESFSSLAETIEKLPNMERHLSQANLALSRQLRRFVENIDQTVAIISRARGVGERILRHSVIQDMPKESFPS